MTGISQTLLALAGAEIDGVNLSIPQAMSLLATPDLGGMMVE